MTSQFPTQMAALVREALGLYRDGRKAVALACLSTVTAKDRIRLRITDRCAWALAWAVCAPSGADALGLLRDELDAVEAAASPSGSAGRRFAVGIGALTLGYELSRRCLELGSPQEACSALSRVALFARTWVRSCGHLGGAASSASTSGAASPGCSLDDLWGAVTCSPFTDSARQVMWAFALAWAVGLVLSSDADAARGIFATCRRWGSSGPHDGAPSLLLLEALVRAASGDTPRAIEVLRSNLCQEKFSSACDEFLAHLMLLGADAPHLGAQGRIRAVSEAAALLAGGGTSCAALNSMGVALATRGEDEASQVQFQDAIRLDDARLEPAFNLAVLYYASGAITEARELLLYIVDRRQFQLNRGKMVAVPPLVVKVPAGQSLPSMRALLWGVAIISITLRDWPVALAALDGMTRDDGSDGGGEIAPFSSPFSSGLVQGVEVVRARALVLLELDRPREALRVTLEVSCCAFPTTCFVPVPRLARPLCAPSLRRHASSTGPTPSTRGDGG